MKQVLEEEYNNQENLQTLLDKQKELFGLEKHLESLQQGEQVAQIIHNHLEIVNLSLNKKT